MRNKRIIDLTHCLNNDYENIQCKFNDIKYGFEENMGLNQKYDFIEFETYVSKQLIKKVCSYMDWTEEIEQVFNDNNLNNIEKYNEKLQLIITTMDNVKVFMLIDYYNQIIQIISCEEMANE
jgi:hypothetical protein